MRRSMIRLAAVAAAGLLLAACGGGADTASEDAATSGSEQTRGDDQNDSDVPADGGDTTGGDMDDDVGGGDDTADSDDATGGDMDGDMSMDMSGAYGEPADASEADRTIEVEVDNELVFQPAEYEVAAGEVVTFRISNIGDIEHEFVLGDEQAQQQMAEEMAEGDGHAHSGEMTNAVTIHPGEEAELTWRFPDEATTVLVGCHVVGHYEAGMRGTVTVG